MPPCSSEPPEAALPPAQRVGGFCQLVRAVRRLLTSMLCGNFVLRAVSTAISVLCGKYVLDMIDERLSTT